MTFYGCHSYICAPLINVRWVTDLILCAKNAESVQKTQVVLCAREDECALERFILTVVHWRSWMCVRDPVSTVCETETLHDWARERKRRVNIVQEWELSDLLLCRKGQVSNIVSKGRRSIIKEAHEVITTESFGILWVYSCKSLSADRAGRKPVHGCFCFPLLLMTNVLLWHHRGLPACHYPSGLRRILPEGQNAVSSPSFCDIFICRLVS